VYNYTKPSITVLTADLKFTDKVGEFEYTIGGNATTMFTQGLLNMMNTTYRWAYQQHKGKAADAIYGIGL